MDVIILGGGLSALTSAYYLQERKDISSILILEKEETLGGLCRSFESNGVVYDIGPHIFFSKDVEILELMESFLGENKSKIRRSNRIIHKNKMVQYPFENDLSQLPEDDKNLCVTCFLNNPYEDYEAKNMLQFFLKTFGSGITDIYLRPYNEKIWKFDPAFMDTQMVERIPRPPKEDILQSAEGKTIDGYLHQLYFSYPKYGGTESLIKALIENLNSKVSFVTSTEVLSISNSETYSIETSTGFYSADKVISTIPLNVLACLYKDESQTSIKKVADRLRYNSIITCVVHTAKDLSGDNFAFMTADKDIIFHRLSKVNFLGDSYHSANSAAAYLVEITYRKGDVIDSLSDDEVKAQVFDGLKKIQFIENQSDVIHVDMKKFEYAYVIYDLEHKKNTELLSTYFNQKGIVLNGRFGSFEYLNMDAIFEQSKEMARRFS